MCFGLGVLCFGPSQLARASSASNRGIERPPADFVAIDNDDDGEDDDESVQVDLYDPFPE